MRSRADTGRGKVDLAWIGFGTGDEFWHRLCGKRWIDQHDIRAAADEGDRRNVTGEIEIEFVVERCVDRVVEEGHQERITVSRRPHDRFGGDIATRARPVLNNEWLTEPF